MVFNYNLGANHVKGIAKGNGGTLLIGTLGLFTGSHNGFGVGIIFTIGVNTVTYIHENLSGSGWTQQNTIIDLQTGILTNNSSSSMQVSRYT